VAGERMAEVRINLGGVVPLSTVDWPGRAATVVFLRGCPLNCPHCHNRSIHSGRSLADISLDMASATPVRLAPNQDAVQALIHPAGRVSRQISLQSFCLPEDVKRALMDPGMLVSAIVLSGGEPLAQAEGAAALAREAHRRGLLVGLETSGCYPARLADLIEHRLLDRIFLDVKGALQDEEYARATGCSRAAGLAKRSLEILAASGLPFEVRMTVFPEMPSPRSIMETASLLLDLSAKYPDCSLESLVLQQGVSEVGEFEPVNSEMLRELAGSLSGLPVRVVEQPTTKKAKWVEFTRPLGDAES